MSSSRPPHEPPLTRAQAGDVLRYWLASLKLEEALDVRPKARRVPAGAAVPRVDVPTPGQEYFKLPLDGELAQLLGERRPVERAFDAELAQFFETWLHLSYRRGDEEGELSHLACFPVVHLPRGELAGLLRYCVRLRFVGRAGESFRAPTRAERERRLFPAPPASVRIGVVARDEGAWPFFVDTRLLRHPLGVPGESIDALFDALRARDEVSEGTMLALVVRLLEHTQRDLRGEDHAGLVRALAEPVREGVEALLARLTSAVEALLRQADARARVYPVAVVVDGTAAKTTWHLQRELSALLQEGGAPEGPLAAYLTGRKLEGARTAQKALFAGPPLTERQREAAETFWGSTLCAVQGPPGTGKTTLILHLAAEALVRKVAPLAQLGAMGDDVLLVTSSNNRAVDNVVEGLELGGALPLALRTGSRQVAEEVLAPQLRRALSFLEGAAREPVATRAAALESAREAFARAKAQVDGRHAPRQRADEARAERAELEAKSRRWAAEQLADADAHESDALLGALSAEQVARLLEALVPLERRLEALGTLCEATPGLAQVNAVARHYGRTAGRELSVFESALGQAGLTSSLPLPPLVAPLSPEALMEAWEEGTEQSLAELATLREQLERRVRREGRVRSQAELAARLASLPPETALPEVPRDDEADRALFACAVALREAWAKSCAPELCAALASALASLDEERTLRPLLRNDPEAARWLFKLFGLWGATLLSLANVFPAEPGSLAHVVIDEAGQCHPAHAVSALLRARSALVIGDVHQLAPVVDLTPDDDARLAAGARLKLGLRELSPYRVNTSSHASAQSLADRAVRTRLVLVDHFRCQPEIIAVSDALCGYGLRVHTTDASRAAEAPWLAHPVLWHDLCGEQVRLGSSLVNERELAALFELATDLFRSGIAPSDVAVITPYRGQLERLRRGFLERRVPIESSQELVELEPSGAVRRGLALGTVHRFQGGERSVVLFSSVITREASLPFLDGRPNLLNVAVSRARHHFIAIGHRAVLARGVRTRLLAEAARPLMRGP